jgi:hypothetical protein
MVGGKVAGIVLRCDGTILLNVEGSGCEKNDTRTVVVRGEEDISIGDSVWWQGSRLYWTSERHGQDIPLTMESHS